MASGGTPSNVLAFDWGVKLFAFPFSHPLRKEVKSDMQNTLQELDLTFQELEVLEGLGNCAGVDSKTCDVLTGTGVSMSVAGITLTIVLT